MVRRSHRVPAVRFMLLEVTWRVRSVELSIVIALSSLDGMGQGVVTRVFFLEVSLLTGVSDSVSVDAVLLGLTLLLEHACEVVIRCSWVLFQHLLSLQFGLRLLHLLLLWLLLLLRSGRASLLLRHRLSLLLSKLILSDSGRGSAVLGILLHARLLLHMAVLSIRGVLISFFGSRVSGHVNVHSGALVLNMGRVVKIRHHEFLVVLAMRVVIFSMLEITNREVSWSESGTSSFVVLFNVVRLH